MIEIDGAEGGGQLVRSALTCSLLTGHPVTVTDVRGDRSSPGLRHQHVAAVRLIDTLTTGSVTGAAVGSAEITVEPGRIDRRMIEIDIGTAGSITLLFDTLLPLAMALAKPMRVRARGGTDVKWSPSMGWYRAVKLPLLREWGIAVAVDVDRRGFYPTGGGIATLTIAPSNPGPLLLRGRGEIERIALNSVATVDLADADVAERQLTSAEAALESAGHPVADRTTRYVTAESSGTAIIVAAQFESSRAGFHALGEKGTPAETIGERPTERFHEFLQTDGAVDAHLADQLLVPLAVTGGVVRLPEITDHVTSNVELLRSFGFEIEIDSGPKGPRVTSPPASDGLVQPVQG